MIAHGEIMMGHQCCTSKELPSDGLLSQPAHRTGGIFNLDLSTPLAQGSEGLWELGVGIKSVLDKKRSPSSIVRW